MDRIYENVIKQHLNNYHQMVFVTGPRQVGKTTIAQNIQTSFPRSKYLNWDIAKDRSLIFSGNENIISGLQVDVHSDSKPLIIFDEIHKFANWKNFLKGFYDEFKGKILIIVTGSSRLDIYKKGQDSLAGRYFQYPVFPISVGEIIRHDDFTTQIQMPVNMDKGFMDNLMEFGGFPEPFIRADNIFYQRWHELRTSQIIYEDIASLTQIHNLSLTEQLYIILQSQVGQLVNYSNLAKKIQVTIPTVKNWLSIFESFYFYFTISPWYNNVARSLVKEPKIYSWDWSLIKDDGARLENFVACHLYKAVHYWQMMGHGKYSMHFLRDKEKREVDFLICKNDSPWLMVEVKSSDKHALSKNLLHFQKQLKAEHVLQVACDLAYGNYDCFAIKEPRIVSMSSFLSQLP